MTRYVAFLRGLNVGGHTVKMADLKRHVESLGLADVTTFIASGNVLFESNEDDTAALETRIEARLEKELGYGVATFLRSDAEVRAIAALEPFPGVPVKDGDRRHVTFLKAAPEPKMRAALLALSTDDDVLAVHGRELYWLRRGQMMDSTITEKEFRRAFAGAPTTARNLNTVQRLVAKLTPK